MMPSFEGRTCTSIRDGLITESDIAGDLFDLTRGTCSVRSTPEAITLFKSVETGLEDLAAAGIAAERFYSSE